MSTFVRRTRSRLDRVSDAVSPRNIRAASAIVRRKLGITKGGLMALGAGVLLWTMGRVIAGTGVYLASYGAFILLGIAYLVAPRRLQLEGDRHGLFPRAQEGDRLEVEVILRARRRAGTFVLEERLPERLGTVVRVPVTRLSAGSEVSHNYGLRCQRRGVYTVGPLVAVAGDPLGLYQRETVVAESFELLVHPRVEVVSDRPLTRQFEDPPIRPPVSRPWPSGLEFYGMRDYVPGDDLRRIVWRATARTGRLMVREAEQGITDHITIVLNTDRGTHSRADPDGASESFETAIRAAASLGVRHLREGYELRAEVSAGPLTRPLRGSGSEMFLLDALARLDMDREPVGSAIMRLVSSPRRDAHNIFITPSLGAEEAARLKLLLNTGVSVLVVALLWEEESEVVSRAAGLGCQVVGVRPGQDLTSALYHDIGAGSR